MLFVVALPMRSFYLLYLLLRILLFFKKRKDKKITRRFESALIEDFNGKEGILASKGKQKYAKLSCA